MPLTKSNVHIIHVGNMNNKGTQALFKSDVHTIRNTIKGDVFITVSTTDVEGVKGLNLPLASVLPPMVDIPYEKADCFAKKFGCSRSDIKYKSFALAAFIYMFIQIALSVFSITLAKTGLKAFYRAEVIENVKKCDIVVSHSDESFKESASLLPLNIYWVMTWWSMLIARTWEILVAKSFRKPVVMFPNSVGPFRTWVGRCLARLSLGNCDYVLIRDITSYKIVDTLGIQSCRILTFDTALLFNSTCEKVIADFPRPLLGISPGIYSHSMSKAEVRAYIVAHAKALDAAIEKYGFFVVFLPHYVSNFEYDDLEMCEAIIHEMKNKERVRLCNTSSVEEFKFFLDQMDIIISSKMHPAVLGASGYVPILCIAYDHKQTGFFERLNMSDCTLDIRNVSSEALLSKIDYVWNRNDQLRASLKNIIPEWQKNVKEGIKQAIMPFIKRK